MDQYPASDRRRAVERALAGLPLSQREAVCLCLLAGKSTADVAEMLGVGRAQVARLVTGGLSAIAANSTDGNLRSASTLNQS